MSIKINDNTLLSLNEQYHIPEKFHVKLYDYNTNEEYRNFCKENFVKYKDKFDLSTIPDEIVRLIIYKQYNINKEGNVEIFVHEQSFYDEDISKTDIENIIEEKVIKCGYDEDNLKLLNYNFSFRIDEGENPKFVIHALLVSKDDSLLKYNKTVSKIYYKYCEKMNKVRELACKAHDLELEINNFNSYEARIEEK